MKDKYFSKDNFYYPNTHIPKNKLNIKNINELNEIEIIKYRNLYEEYIDKLPSLISIKYFKRIHLYFFSDIYSWAGKIRKVKISKGNITFCYPQYIEKEMSNWTSKYGNTNNILNMNKEAFAKYLAEMKTEFLIIHPFREGNGRLIRFVMDMLAYNNGYDLIWKNYNFTIKKREKYFLAMKKALLEKDYTDIEKIIFENLIKLNK